jgi:hypothetical protein
MKESCATPLQRPPRDLPERSHRIPARGAKAEECQSRAREKSCCQLLRALSPCRVEIANSSIHQFTLCSWEHMSAIGPSLRGHRSAIGRHAVVIRCVRPVSECRSAAERPADGGLIVSCGCPHLPDTLIE